MCLNHNFDLLPRITDVPCPPNPIERFMTVVYIISELFWLFGQTEVNKFDTQAVNISIDYFPKLDDEF